MNIRGDVAAMQSGVKVCSSITKLIKTIMETTSAAKAVSMKAFNTLFCLYKTNTGGR